MVDYTPQGLSHLRNGPAHRTFKVQNFLDIGELLSLHPWTGVQPGKQFMNRCGALTAPLTTLCDEHIRRIRNKLGRSILGNSSGVRL